MTEILVNAGVSLAGIIITAITSYQLIKYRVDQLEKKVDKHNNVIERVFKLEQKVEDKEMSHFSVGVFHRKD